MKAISLTQPWATAIAQGLKQWETRSWPTKFRGDVCIHASKGFPKWAKEFAAEKGLAELPLGAIICVANITSCVRTEIAVRDGLISLGEQEWGDYAEGRYCFKLENVRVLRDPVFAKGALGFWPVLWDEANEVARALKSLCS